MREQYVNSQVEIIEHCLNHNIMRILLLFTGAMQRICVNARIKQAYATSSRQSYYNKFVMFLTFCMQFDINVFKVSVDNAIAFL